MARAIWKDTVIADSDSTVLVEGNHYFPAASVKMELLRQAKKTSVCGWKGTANYYDLQVGDELNESAAWVYRDPKSAAANIQGHIAFWKGVVVEA